MVKRVHGISPATAETGVPTAVADGDDVNPWVDEYGRQVGKTDDLSEGATIVKESAPALLQTKKPNAETQLTAPGSTGNYPVEGDGVYGFEFTVANIDTNALINLQTSGGSVIPILNDAVANVTITNNVMTITANGNYLIYADAPAVDVELAFDETGGTNATIDSQYFARRK